MCVCVCVYTPVEHSNVCYIGDASSCEHVLLLHRIPLDFCCLVCTCTRFSVEYVGKCCCFSNVRRFRFDMPVQRHINRQSQM